MENRKISALLAEQAEQEVEKEVIPPSVEEQKAMWSNNGADPITPLSQPNTNNQFGGYSSGMSGLPTPPPSGIPTSSTSIEMDPDLAELISASPPPTSIPTNSQASELLAAFTEDDAVDSEAVDYEFDEIANSEEIWSPSDDPLAGISPPVPEIIDAPELEPEPEIVPEPEPLVESTINDRVVRQSCSNCGKLFEVEMPLGVDIARTSCPHCESVETIRFE